MKSYVTNFLSGLFGRFRRNPSGELECTGLALEDDGAKVVKLMSESLQEERLATIADATREATRVAIDQTIKTERERAATLDSDPEYQAALEAGDSEVLARIAAAFGKRKP